jgi:twitching motility protein PilT
MTFEHVNLEPVERWIAIMCAAGATDLMLTPGSAPRMRIDGRLRPIPGEETLGTDACEKTILAMLTTDLREQLAADKEIDFSFTYETTHRFRANCFERQNSLSLALRAIPLTIPSFDDLRLPPALAAVCDKPQGFVLVTGPTGSGKSTTLASMIDHINQTCELHILTIEDPIEYVHEHKRSAVNQREVGIDTHSFDRALRAALREDPDVILVGEMRDPETIQFALTLAETGHLVFATLHTNDAAQAIDRISDVFPAERQDQIRVMLAGSMVAVISQRLIPRSGGGLIAAFEVLLANSAVRNLVREGNSHQLRNIMHSSRADGMLTLEASLNGLVAEGIISYDEAVAHSMYPKEIKRAAVHHPNAPSGATAAG